MRLKSKSKKPFRRKPVPTKLPKVKKPDRQQRWKIIFQVTDVNDQSHRVAIQLFSKLKEQATIFGWILVIEQTNDTITPGVKRIEHVKTLAVKGK